MIPKVVDVLEPSEARAARDQVHALRAAWTRQSLSAEFYTLGVSAYIEAQNRGAVSYTFAAKRLNPMLEEAFGDVYERVRATLERFMGEPVSYSPRLALPGFHIFLADPAFSLPVCMIHVDQPYKNLHWPAYEAVDTRRTLSFTLSLALPKGGAGLRVWHQISPEQAVTGPSLIEQTTGLEPTHHAYTVGRMVIHDGHSIHQIAPFVGLGDGDERITLQGHAIHGAQGWLAYF